MALLQKDSEGLELPHYLIQGEDSSRYSRLELVSEGGSTTIWYLAMTLHTLGGKAQTKTPSQMQHEKKMYY